MHGLLVLFPRKLEDRRESNTDISNFSSNCVTSPAAYSSHHDCPTWCSLSSSNSVASFQRLLLTYDEYNHSSHHFKIAVLHGRRLHSESTDAILECPGTQAILSSRAL
ncbi:hypothetical protein BD410DRAFT_463631 [Rickenella mellea]|uniref:Uncharacterized protein n=1 Tax=Rickenella mellea TaxID=50990 RepID=A0A4Y7PUM1_9AGAM|nr:hypothetical protein BD410DRAFT_463631 [Rickenella mellea]